MSAWTYTIPCPYCGERIGGDTGEYQDVRREARAAYQQHVAAAHPGKLAYPHEKRAGVPEMNKFIAGSIDKPRA